MRSRDSRILPATRYRLAMVPVSAAGGALPARSARWIWMVPRRSRAQSLYTSRTSSMADPAGSVMYCGPGLRRAGPKRSSKEPSGGHLDLPVVERGQAVRHLGRRVVPVQHLEAQVGGAAPAAGDHVLRVVPQVGVEVQGVRVVQAHLGVRAGGRDEVREVALVGPGQLDRAADVAGQVVVAFGEILLGLDVRGAGDDRLGFEQRVGERLGEHPLRLERVLETGQCLGADRDVPGVVAHLGSRASRSGCAARTRSCCRTSCASAPGRRCCPQAGSG